MAEKEFEDLLKNVTAINSRLEITSKLLVDLTQRLQGMGQNRPLQEMVRTLENDIRRLQQLRQQMTYEGVSKAASPTPVSTEALAARQKVINAVESSLNSYKRELDAAVARIQAQANRPISTGLRRAADRTIYGGEFIYPQPPPDRASRARSIFPEAYGIGSGIGEGPVSTIPHPTKNISTNEDFLQRRAQLLAKQVAEKVMAAVEADARKINLTEALATGAGSGGAFNRFNQRITERLRIDAFKAGRLPTFEQNLRDREFGAANVSSAQDRNREQQERLLRTLRARILSEEKYTNALEQARRQGFNINNLTRVQSRGTAGIEQLQFQRMDESGVQRRFDTYVAPSGRATPGISNQFRSFGQGVLRDIGELTKWSIALAAVYGPMRKLQELTQIMIENQTKLAEATISVGSAFLDQDEIFNVVAESAERAGESISTTIDAFTQAYRATGGAGDQVERLATAQNLLNNSLILSKLSTLDQAAAIDTLSAALRQTTGDLEGGAELLDKWVRVTKIANVDLASLATGFAVLGDAAEAAQIDTDELNGVLAAIAETGVASGRELANTARAIVAGFQSDQAREALENIGVAFSDSTGQARPFLEIMQELSQLRESGILDDTAFSKLTLALGGGTRRQAAYATFIENFERVGEVAAESSRAAGDAQAALARQLETVQTSITRLGNAFQELAQSLGTEGGFLGLITQGVDGMTALVKVFDSLTSSLGKATPALAAFIATSLILRQRGQGGIQQALLGFGQGLERDPISARYYTNPAQAPAAGRGRQLLQNLTGTGALAGGVQGLVAAAIPAILNATNKEDRFGGTKAVADIIGGVGGGIVGSLVAGSPIIGAAVGTAIAEAFVNNTIARSTNIFGYTQAPGLAGEPSPAQTQEDLDKALRDAEIEGYKSIGGGSEAIGRLVTSSSALIAESLVEQINKAIETQDRTKLEQIFRGRQYGTTGGDILSGAGITREFIEQAFKGRQQLEFNSEYLAFQQFSPEAQQRFREAEAARLATGGTPRDEETAFGQMVAQNNTLYSTLIGVIKESSTESLRQERISGDVTGAAYGRRAAAIGGFDIKAIQYYTALGSEIDKITGGAEDAEKAFEVLNNVITRGPEEGLQQLTALTGEISTLVNLLDDPALHEDRISELFPEDGIEGARQRLEELRETLGSIIVDINREALVGQIQIPELQGDVNKPLSQEDFSLVKQRAQELQDSFYEGFLQIPDDMYDALKGSWDEWAQIIEKSGDVFFEKVSEIDPQFFQQAMQQLLEENKLRSQKVDQFDIQQLDITSQQGAGLQGSINYFSKYLAQNFPQYQQNPEDVGVIFSDYVTSVLHGDNLAIKLALEKLVDINQKQLDGMYNIPEGATFWVPLTAAYYRPQNGAGAGGLPEIGGEAANTSALNENTNALRELSFAFKGDLGYAPRTPEYLSKIPKTPGFPGDRGQSREADENRRLALGFRGDTGQSRAAVQPAQAGARDENILQQLLNTLRNLFGPRSPAYGGSYDPRPNVGGRPGFGSTTPAQVNPVVNARLDMRIDNNTQLIVDGRVLASVITPYLASDLIRLEAAQGTITKRIII